MTTIDYLKNWINDLTAFEDEHEAVEYLELAIKALGENVQLKAEKECIYNSCKALNKEIINTIREKNIKIRQLENNNEVLRCELRGIKIDIIKAIDLLTPASDGSRAVEKARIMLMRGLEETK